MTYYRIQAAIKRAARVMSADAGAGEAVVESAAAPVTLAATTTETDK